MATVEQIRMGTASRRAGGGQGTLRSGIIAGVIAGVAMALTMMAHSLSMGMGFWTPMKTIAATWLGLGALIGGPGVVLLGLVTHFVCAAFWGAVFASLIWRRESVAAAFWEGLVYSVAVWLIMTYIGLPIFDQTMLPRVAMLPGWWFYEHLVYGACLCVTPAVRRALYPAAERPAHHARPRETTVV